MPLLLDMVRIADFLLLLFIVDMVDMVLIVDLF